MNICQSGSLKLRINILNKMILGEEVVLLEPSESGNAMFKLSKDVKLIGINVIIPLS